MPPSKGHLPHTACRAQAQREKGGFSARQRPLRCTSKTPDRFPGPSARGPSHISQPWPGAQKRPSSGFNPTPEAVHSPLGCLKPQPWPVRHQQEKAVISEIRLQGLGSEVPSTRFPGRVVPNPLGQEKYRGHSSDFKAPGLDTQGHCLLPSPPIRQGRRPSTRLPVSLWALNRLHSSNPPSPHSPHSGLIGGFSSAALFPNHLPPLPEDHNYRAKLFPR